MPSRLFRIFAAISILQMLAPSAQAVYQTVVIEKPFHVRALAGITLDMSGASVSGVEVQDCDRGFTQVFASTTSDKDGIFSLPRGGRSVHYLKFRANGFNPLEITVILGLSGHGKLKVKLPIGG